jgi:hypothetical protein
VNSSETRSSHCLLLHIENLRNVNGHGNTSGAIVSLVRTFELPAGRLVQQPLTDFRQRSEDLTCAARGNPFNSRGNPLPPLGCAIGTDVAR